VAIALVAVHTANDAQHTAEDLALQKKLEELIGQQSLLEEALKSKLGGWRRPDEFHMKELNTMLEQSAKLNHSMRAIFTRIKMRETEQGLANFRALLVKSFKDQGFEKDIPKIEKMCKEHYLVIPETIEYISENWHTKEAQDKDSKKIDGFEREYHLLLFDHDWLLRNSYRPIPDLSGTLKKLHANRDSLNSWLKSPVVGNHKKNFVETSSETEAEAETETEAESEPESQSEVESDELPHQDPSQDMDSIPEFSFAESRSKTETEAEDNFLGNSVDFSFAEADSTSEDGLLDENIDGAMQSEAEMEADAEFGAEDSEESLAAEAQALDKMEAQFHHQGLV